MADQQGRRFSYTDIKGANTFYYGVNTSTASDNGIRFRVALTNSAS